MKNKTLNILVPHIIVTILFIVISFSYFLPAPLDGKILQGGDKVTSMGQARELRTYRELNGTEKIAWTNSMFGGMPAYTIGVKKDEPIKYIGSKLFFFLKHPVNCLFAAMICFYIFLLCYGVKPWLSIVGAIAYGFSSYFIIIIGAGHNTKMISLAYMPVVIGGVLLVFKKKRYLLGTTLMTLFLILEIGAGHYQIVYYTMFIIIAIGIAYLIQAYKEKSVLEFSKKVGILSIGALFAILVNIASLWTMNEYSKYSIRGVSELTKSENTNNRPKGNNGLDFDYVTSWSYGKAETLNLLIPNFRGGSSSGELSEKSEIYKLFAQRDPNYAKKIIKQMPLYWGPQPFTEGPVYLGAVLIFLFIFGLLFLKKNNYDKWWIISISIIVLLLAWGKNFDFFTRLFFNYFPLYNKFRAVSMILVVLQFTVPFIAIIALKRLIYEKYTHQQFIHAFKWALITVGGICCLFTLLPQLAGDFSAAGDNAYAKNTDFLNALKTDRESILRADAFRSLAFIVLSAGWIYAYYSKKLKLNTFIIGIGALILIDLFVVDKRYLSNDDFKNKKQSIATFTPSKADKNIVMIETNNPENKQKLDLFYKKHQDHPYFKKLDNKEFVALNLTTNYRVLNLTRNPFSDAITSYFHKSIGGYNGAKMRNFQDLIDEKVLDLSNMDKSFHILNMLNTKYIIVDTEKPPYANKNALGNAWFVKKIKFVDDANQEIEAIKNFDPKQTAIIDQRFKKLVKNIGDFDSTATIKLIKYSPDYLIYETKTKSEMVAVFSEIYYEKGWNTYLNNTLIPHYRANYLLRAMNIPQGKNTIAFKFEPKSYFIGNKITYYSSLIVIGFLIIALGYEGKYFYKTINK